MITEIKMRRGVKETNGTKKSNVRRIKRREVGYILKGRKLRRKLTNRRREE